MANVERSRAIEKAGKGAIERRRESEPSWGMANENRGIGYAKLAVEFAKSYKVGRQLSAHEFDEWAWEREKETGLRRVPSDSPKSSDVWLAHLQRRHQLRYNINKAATHPRMKTTKWPPYTITSLTGGIWEVQSPQRAAINSGIPRNVASLVLSKRKRLSFLMQSADWENIPPYEKIMAETLYDEIASYQKRIVLDCDDLTARFVRLEGKIRKMVEAGEVRPTNGGVAALLGAKPSDDDVMMLDEEDEE